MCMLTEKRGVKMDLITGDLFFQNKKKYVPS